MLFLFRFTFICNVPQGNISSFMCVEIKTKEGSEEVSSTELSKTPQTQKQEANTAISERLGIDVGL